ncbi:MAG: hypothetical protein HZB29_09825 [Nitrospinae bacterium]|nr:hypothetical protein [Nitrospinota bacterium]
MALTSGKQITRKGDDLFAAPVAAAAKIYEGALVSAKATGYAAPATDTAGEHFLGVARIEADNTGGTNGAITVEGYREDVHELTGAGAMTQADVGEDAYVVDDATVGRGIAAQPVNVTGVVLKRIATSRGGTRALAFTAAGTTLGYGGGSAVNVGAGGEFVLTATDGAQILAVVTAANIPNADKSDNIQLRHVRAGKITGYVSATEVWVDLAR